MEKNFALGRKAAKEEMCGQIPQRSTDTSLFKNIRKFEGWKTDFNLWSNDIERVAKAIKYEGTETYYLAVDNIAESRNREKGEEPNWREFKSRLAEIYATKVL